MSLKMHHKNLGKSGLRVSMVGLGTWVTFGAQTSDETAEEILTLAYESGINFFDTAEVYAAGKIHFTDQIAMRAEIVLGKILQKKSWRRSSYIVSSKIYWGGKAETEKGLSRKHIIEGNKCKGQNYCLIGLNFVVEDEPRNPRNLIPMKIKDFTVLERSGPVIINIGEGLKGSLERLQLDYVDVVFANKPDVHTPMEETVRAFTHVINQGWAMYWGTSRWSPTEIMEAYSVARQFNLIPPIAEQTEYHLFQREKVETQMPELYHKIGIGTVIWSPLASGILTGKYDDGIPIYSRAALKGYSWLKDKILSDEGRRQQTKLREVAEIADKIGCSLSQLAIAWCLKNENVHCVLLGASTVDQLYENIQALQYVPKLTSSIMHELDKLLGNRPSISRRDNVSRSSEVETKSSTAPVKYNPSPRCKMADNQDQSNPWSGFTNKRKNVR